MNPAAVTTGISYWTSPQMQFTDNRPLLIRTLGIALALFVVFATIAIRMEASISENTFVALAAIAALGPLFVLFIGASIARQRGGHPAELYLLLMTGKGGAILIALIVLGIAIKVIEYLNS